MSGMNIVFIAVRVLHVLCAALWLGASVFGSVFLLPVLQQAGPNAAMVMAGLARRGLASFMSGVGGVTVLSGLWLYWRFTDGFDPGLSASMAGRVFGTGGLLGIAAAVIGGSIVGRSAQSATTLGAKAAGLPEGAERAALLAEIQRLRLRMVKFGDVVTVLLVVAIVLMAMGHYV